MATPEDQILAELEETLKELDRGRRVKSQVRTRSVKSAGKVSVRLTALLVILAVAGTTLALTQTTLPSELLELWGTQYIATDFTVVTFKTKFSGLNEIKIDIKIKNTDITTAHFANVTVQLLNTTGDLLAEQTQATGSVAPDSEQSLPTFRYTQANLVAEYSNAQIIISQSS